MQKLTLSEPLIDFRGSMFFSPISPVEGFQLLLRLSARVWLWLRSARQPLREAAEGPPAVLGLPDVGEEDGAAADTEGDGPPVQGRRGRPCVCNGPGGGTRQIFFGREAWVMETSNRVVKKKVG